MKSAFRYSLRTIALCLLAIWLTAGQSFAQDETVRIRLLENFNPTIVTVKAVGAPVKVYAGEPGMPLGQIRLGESARFGANADQVTAVLPTENISSTVIRLEPGASGELEIVVEETKRLLKPRTYRGSVEIDADLRYASRLRLINEVDLEEYVASVLPREYPFESLEGAKAMAIVIRTYALQSGGRHGADYDHTDHIGSQVYDGSSHVTELSRQAARLTEGMVLTYGGELIEATYSASNGGYTANNEDVWKGQPLPYLRAKTDPYDASPHRNWTSSVPRMQLLGVLTAIYGDGKRVEGFTPGSKGPDGRIRFVHIDIEGERRRTITANEFRLLVNRHFGVESLKSAMFTIRENRDSYEFQGSGYGHGVGLSQWGAHGMAERGHTYEDILAFYYTGVNVAELDRSFAVREQRGTNTPVIRASNASPSRTESSEKRAGW